MTAQIEDPPCCSSWGFAFAHLITRLWVAMRLVMAGVDKFRKGNGWDHTTFNMENYHEKSTQIATLMSTNSFLPENMCVQFANVIGYLLLGVGAWVAVGLITELSLFAAGIVLLMLGFGLAALPDDTEVVMNIGLTILVTAAALMTARAKTFSIDRLFCRRKKVVVETPPAVS